LYLLGSIDVPLFKVFTHTFVEFQFFAAGTLLAIWLRQRPTFYIRNSLRFSLAIIGFGLALTFVCLLRGGGFRLIVAFACLTASVICIFVSFYGMKVPSACSPLIYLGRISYGLYVFHAFGIVFATHLLLRMHIQTPSAMPVAALLLTVGMAAPSYRYIEKPFLRLKRRFTFVESRPQ
jgi:peptidoglycan/LPS O-acetylase OafA/YrhL